MRTSTAHTLLVGMLVTLTLPAPGLQAAEYCFAVGDSQAGLDGQFDFPLRANILANVLIEFASELTAAVAPGGTLVLSGILAAECGQVQVAFAAEAPDWHQESHTLGEWSDVVLTRPRL